MSARSLPSAELPNRRRAHSSVVGWSMKRIWCNHEPTRAPEPSELDANLERPDPREFKHLDVTCASKGGTRKKAEFTLP